MCCIQHSAKPNCIRNARIHISTEVTNYIVTVFEVTFYITLYHIILSNCFIIILLTQGGLDRAPLHTYKMKFFLLIFMTLIFEVCTFHCFADSISLFLPLTSRYDFKWEIGV